MKYDPFRFSRKTPALLSYKVVRRNKVNTYTIKAKRGTNIFEKKHLTNRKHTWTFIFVKIILKLDNQVEIWAVDYWISAIKGDLYEILKSVGLSDSEYVEPTSDKLREAKEAR
jgi:hypothetical protein